MPDSTNKQPKLPALAIIILLMGLCLFLAVIFRSNIVEFYSRIPRNEFGFCAIAAIVILPTYALFALIIIVLSRLQKKNKK